MKLKNNTMIVRIIMLLILISGFVHAQTADEYYESGRNYMTNGDFRSAIEDFTKALEIDSLYVEAWTARGDAWEEIGIYGEATEDWMQAYYLHGNDRFDEGSFADACRYWSMAAEMGHPEAKSLYRNHCKRKAKN